MADGDLQSIISGVDPTAAAQLQALQGQSIAGAAANPLYWQNQGIFGGLARQMALGQGMDMARSGVNSAVAANLAAQPDLAAAMASPNPMGYPAANPNMDPLARARLIQAFSGPGPRLELGQTEQAQSAAGLTTAETVQRQLQNAARIQALREAGVLPGGGGAVPVGGGAPTTGTPAVGTGARLPPSSATPFGSGHYPPPPAQPDQAPPAPIATGQAPSPLGTIPPAGPQRMAWLQSLTPAMRAMVLSRLAPTPGATTTGR